MLTAREQIVEIAAGDAPGARFRREADDPSADLSGRHLPI